MQQRPLQSTHPSQQQHLRGRVPLHYPVAHTLLARYYYTPTPKSYPLLSLVSSVAHT